MSSHSDDYEQLIQPIERQMMRAVWRILRDADDAADAFQQATETVWKKRDRIRKHANPHGYVLRVCVSAAYDVLRKRLRHREREELKAAELVISPAPSAIEGLISREVMSQVHSAIGQLPRNQAEAVLMRLVEGLPYEDVARALGCSEATARTHIARARGRLGELLAHLRPPLSKEPQP